MSKRDHEQQLIVRPTGLLLFRMRTSLPVEPALPERAMKVIAAGLENGMSRSHATLDAKPERVD
jgi:hypothetical protein